MRFGNLTHHFFKNKEDIEDYERKIRIYTERLEELKKETPKDLLKVETGFDIPEE